MNHLRHGSNSLEILSDLISGPISDGFREFRSLAVTDLNSFFLPSDSIMNQPPSQPPADISTTDGDDSPVVESQDRETSGVPVDDQALNRVSIRPASWLIAGVLSALLVPGVASLVKDGWNEPMPDAYRVSDGEYGPSAEEIESDRKTVTENRLTNEGRLMFAVGSCVALVFGLFAGIMTGRPVMGIAGSVVAMIVAFALAAVTVPQLLNIDQRYANIGDGGDIPMMARHSIAWMMFAIAAFVSVSIATGRIVIGGKVLGSLALGAVVSAVVYVMLASIFEPDQPLGNTFPVTGIPGWIWTSLTPLFGSIVMTRTSRHLTRIESLLPTAQALSNLGHRGEPSYSRASKV